MDERTTEKTKDSAAKQIIRIDRELEALGEKEKKGASEFKYFLDEVGVS